MIFNHRMEANKFRNDSILIDPFPILVKQLIYIFPFYNPSAITIWCGKIRVASLFEISFEALIHSNITFHDHVNTARASPIIKKQQRLPITMNLKRLYIAAEPINIIFFERANNDIPLFGFLQSIDCECHLTLP